MNAVPITRAHTPFWLATHPCAWNSRANPQEVAAAKTIKPPVPAQDLWVHQGMRPGPCDRDDGALEVGAGILPPKRRPTISAAPSPLQRHEIASALKGFILTGVGGEGMLKSGGEGLMMDAVNRRLA